MILAVVFAGRFHGVVDYGTGLSLCVFGGMAIEDAIHPIREFEFGLVARRLCMIFVYGIPAALAGEWRPLFGMQVLPWSPAWSLTMGTALCLILMVRAIVLYRRREARLQAAAPPAES